MISNEEYCTCCGQQLLPKAQKSRPKAKKLPPLPQNATVSRERCTFCGAEPVGDVTGKAERLFYCRGCVDEFGLVLTVHMGIKDRDERIARVKAEMFKRMSSPFMEISDLAEPEQPRARLVQTDG